MGIQAMATQGGGRQRSQILGQGSIYSLTLNEVQNHLGESLHSMNLDELLKSVLPAEANPSLAMDLDGGPARYGSGPDIQRQGSITMTRHQSKKTVDQVWRDIQQAQKKSNEELGEMTLEHFLMNAGVVADGGDKRRIDPVGDMEGVQGFGQGAHWLHQYHQMQQQQQQVMMGAYLYPEGQSTNSSALAGTMSDPQTPTRKRVMPEAMVEKTIERRQKRMIKNRESAARSRARKQAYTNELENKVSRLEEENERLKKQKEFDPIMCYVPPPEPKYQLRRSSSAPL